MSFETVIFDLDGTLLDTLEDLGDAANSVFTRLGFESHPIDSYRRFVGQGLRMLIVQALPEGRRTAETVNRVQVELGAYLRDHPVTKTTPYPGIPELLTRLQSSGVPMGILTNKPDELTRVVVDLLLKKWRFGGVHGQRENVPRKPDPTAAIALAEELGGTPAKTLFVGDSDVDIETGLAAGMTPIGVAWGFRGSKELEAAGAHRVISRPLELLELL